MHEIKHLENATLQYRLSCSKFNFSVLLILSKKWEIYKKQILPEIIFFFLNKKLDTVLMAYLSQASSNRDFQSPLIKADAGSHLP